jgi:energy-coupling factor transporter ATP-binding protein EcfA2
MTDVNLIKQADAIIGGQGSGVAGISGGQRRRLSVAIELLTNPAILILDEPTSGLDATSSHQLVTLLNKIASEHDRTVLLTIHQPRAESFELFDQLLLLGEGGHVVYHGAASGAMDYLAAALPSLDTELYDNPGDFIIDAVGLDPSRDSSCVGSQLASRYQEVGMSDSVLRTVKTYVSGTPDNAGSGSGGSSLCCGSKGQGWPSSIAYQVWVLFARRTRRQMKSWRKAVIVYVQLIFVSLVLGYAMCTEDEEYPTATMVYQVPATAT